MDEHSLRILDAILANNNLTFQREHTVTCDICLRDEIREVALPSFSPDKIEDDSLQTSRPRFPRERCHCQLRPKYYFRTIRENNIADTHRPFARATLDFVLVLAKYIIYNSKYENACQYSLLFTSPVTECRR